MYNGIGLQTPRGSGTSGYVQASKFNIRHRQAKVETKEFKDGIGVGGVTKRANADILEHDRKRQIELKVAMLRDTMEDQGYTEEEIEERANEARKKLEDEASMGLNAPEEDMRNETHHIAARKEKKLDSMKSALRLGEVKEGEAFDRELQEQKKMERILAREEAEKEMKRKEAEEEKERKRLEKERRRAEREEKRRQKEEEKRRRKEEKRRKEEEEEEEARRREEEEEALRREKEKKKEAKHVPEERHVQGRRVGRERHEEVAAERKGKVYSEEEEEKGRYGSRQGKRPKEVLRDDADDDSPPRRSKVGVVAGRRGFEDEADERRRESGVRGREIERPRSFRKTDDARRAAAKDYSDDDDDDDRDDVDGDRRSGRKGLNDHERERGRSLCGSEQEKRSSRGGFDDEEEADEREGRRDDRWKRGGTDGRGVGREGEEGKRGYERDNELDRGRISNVLSAGERGRGNGEGGMRGLGRDAPNERGRVREGRGRDERFGKEGLEDGGQERSRRGREGEGRQQNSRGEGSRRRPRSYDEDEESDEDDASEQERYEGGRQGGRAVGVQGRVSGVVRQRVASPDGRRGGRAGQGDEGRKGLSQQGVRGAAKPEADDDEEDGDGRRQEQKIRENSLKAAGRQGARGRQGRGYSSASVEESDSGDGESEDREVDDEDDSSDGERAAPRSFRKTDVSTRRDGDQRRVEKQPAARIAGRHRHDSDDE